MNSCSLIARGEQCYALTHLSLRILTNGGKT